MNKHLLKVLSLFAILSLTSCGNNGASINSNNRDGSSINYSSEDDPINYSDVGTSFDESDFEGSETEEDFQITTKVTDGYAKEGNIYTITKVGDYTLTGKLNGQIIIDVGESETDVENEVSITLNEVSITSEENSPIFVKSADKVKIKCQKGTYNVINDNRAAKTEDVEGQGEGAIYAKADLNLTGKGTLVVTGKYNNGVHTSKDLKIKNVTLKSTAVNNAIKGNNSITISEEATNILATSESGDGLKTEDSDISSSSGKQRGVIKITGGTINIFAASDGIDASHDVDISNGTDEDSGETTIPVINIYTNKYSGYTGSGEISPTSQKDMYIRMSSGVYNQGKYSFAAQFSDGTTDTMKVATYETSKDGGRGTRYYYYKFSRPSNATQFKLYAYLSSQTPGSLTDYYACSTKYETINTNYDTCTVSTVDINNRTISLSSNQTWSNFSSPSGPGGGGPGGGGWEEGNSDKAEGSAKGIKSDNDINISGGKIYAKTYDDGIHANYGETLENGQVGSGNVNISGGYVEIDASDDGIHADRHLTINGGEVKVTNAYEGAEGADITVNGGKTTLIANDDGMNANGKNNVTACITVNGGYLDVTVPSNGDTDGIDSNGKYIQTGGIVITRGPNSQMASSLDIGDRDTAEMTGGTLICFGKPAATMNYSVSQIKYSYSTGTISTGEHTVTVGDLSVTVNNLYTYSGCYVFSDTLQSMSIK